MALVNRYDMIKTGIVDSRQCSNLCTKLNAIKEPIYRQLHVSDEIVRRGNLSYTVMRSIGYYDFEELISLIQKKHAQSTHTGRRRALAGMANKLKIMMKIIGETK